MIGVVLFNIRMHAIGLDHRFVNEWSLPFGNLGCHSNVVAHPIFINMKSHLHLGLGFA